jgi:hypothetical protein
VRGKAGPRVAAGRRRAALAPGVSLVLLLAPRISEACSKCLSGRSEETKMAYLLTTVFLSVLPPLAIAGVAWWLLRRARALEREEVEGRTPAVARARVSLLG